MSFISSLRASASALTAQRLRMDVVSGNIANMGTTRGADGRPYRKRDVVLTAATLQRGFMPLRGQPATPQGVRVAGITERDGVRLVNDPNHPDADAEGNVAYPDIDLVDEMTTMMSAVRAYEASVAVINAAKSMALKALEIGRG